MIRIWDRYRWSLEKGLQISIRVVEEERQVVEADVAEGVSDTNALMASYVEDNTSQGID